MYSPEGLKDSPLSMGALSENSERLPTLQLGHKFYLYLGIEIIFPDKDASNGTAVRPHVTK